MEYLLLVLAAVILFMAVLGWMIYHDLTTDDEFTS